MNRCLNGHKHWGVRFQKWAAEREARSQSHGSGPPCWVPQLTLPHCRLWGLNPAGATTTSTLPYPCFFWSPAPDEGETAWLRLSHMLMSPFRGWEGSTGPFSFSEKSVLSPVRTIWQEISNIGSGRNAGQTLPHGVDE